MTKQNERHIRMEKIECPICKKEIWGYNENHNKKNLETHIRAKHEVKK